MYFGLVEEFAGSSDHGERLVYFSKALVRLAGLTQSGGNYTEVVCDFNASPAGSEPGKVAPHPRDSGIEVVGFHFRPAEENLAQRAAKWIA